MVEFAVATRDQAPYRTEDIQLGRGEGQRVQGKYVFECNLIFSPQPDYKNNILKERAGLAHSPLPAKDVDPDKGEYFHLPHPT